MKEKPILFSGPMVQAILDGRKTQTRRVIKDSAKHGVVKGVGNTPPLYADCPYGQPGDRLWVRETHRFDGLDAKIAITERRIEELSYRAYLQGDRSIDDCPWRPSIFMPRWASRITMEVTGVRVERLNEISEEDAWAEGCEKGDVTDNGGFFPKEEKLPDGCSIGWDCVRDWYADLWESINGKGSWDADPWVWVIQFRRVK